MTADAIFPTVWHWTTLFWAGRSRCLYCLKRDTTHRYEKPCMKCDLWAAWLVCLCTPYICQLAIHDFDQMPIYCWAVACHQRTAVKLHWSNLRLSLYLALPRFKVWVYIHSWTSWNMQAMRFWPSWKLILSMSRQFGQQLSMWIAYKALLRVFSYTGQLFSWDRIRRAWPKHTSVLCK